LPRLFEREVRRKGTRNLPAVVPNTERERERERERELVGNAWGEKGQDG
jgi:hypothetical protein